MIEIWKDIYGYEGLYQCSSHGNIRSLTRTIIRKTGIAERKNGTMLIPAQNKNGYLQVSLWKDGKRKMVYVHRIVAETFLDADEKRNYVNHIDGNRLNNRVDNLEWVTASENEYHSYSELNRTKNTTGKKPREVFGYDENNNIVCAFPSIEQCSREMKISPTQIRRLISDGKRTKGGILLVG